MQKSVYTAAINNMVWCFNTSVYIFLLRDRNTVNFSECMQHTKRKLIFECFTSVIQKSCHRLGVNIYVCCEVSQTLTMYRKKLHFLPVIQVIHFRSEQLLS